MRVTALTGTSAPRRRWFRESYNYKINCGAARESELTKKNKTPTPNPLPRSAITLNQVPTYDL